MTALSVMLRTLFASLCLGLLCNAQDKIWDATNYPNPTTTGFRECSMLTHSQICDPDGVLSVEDRNRINHELQQMELRTRHDQASTFCAKKGITAALAIARRVRGGSQESTKEMANTMKRTWLLDAQCKKAIILVLVIDDRKFWAARDDLVPVSGDEFTDIFNDQKPLLQNKDYKTALMNIVQKTWEKVLSKASTGSSSGKSSAGSSGTSDDGHSDSKSISISPWVWIALVLIIIPTICCCGCIYCCCCRNKSSGRDGGNNGGSGDIPMRNVFNRGDRQGCNTNYHQGTTYSPPSYSAGVRVPEEGKGLYPSIPKADDGGGGSWGEPQPHSVSHQNATASAPREENKAKDDGGGGSW